MEENYLGRKLNWALYLNLVILVSLFVFSFYRIRLLSHSIDQSAFAEEVLDQVYLLRIEEQRMVFNGDSLSLKQIDSLILRVNALLVQVGDDRVESPMEKKMDRLYHLLQLYRNHLGLYVSHYGFLRNQHLSLLEVFDSMDAHRTRWSDLKHTLPPQKQQVVDSATAVVYQNLSELRVFFKMVDVTRDSVSIESLHRRMEFSAVRPLQNALSRVMESSGKSRWDSMWQLLHRYEHVVVNHSALLLNMSVLYRQIYSEGLQMQHLAEHTGAIQRDYLRQVSNWNKWILALVFATVFLIGGLAFRLFWRNIQKDTLVRRDARLQMEAAKDLLDNMINHSASLIYLKDLQGRYRLVNKQWLAWFQFSQNEVVGFTGEELFSKEIAEVFMEKELTELIAKGTLQVEEKLVWKGETHYFITNKFVIYHSDGTPLYVGGISTDYSEFRSLMNDLKQSRNSYESLVSSVPGIVFKGSWGKHLQMQFLSDGFRRLTGWEPDAYLNTDQWHQLIHPDDLILLELQRAQFPVPGRFEWEYRIRTATGHWKWVHEKGEVHQSDQESGFSVQGVMIDVTEQKSSLSEMMVRDRFLEGVAEAVKELIVNAQTSEAVRRSLRMVGQSALADVCFLFQNQEHDRRTSHRIEWVKNQIDPVFRDNMQEVGFQDISAQWYYLLSEKSEVSVQLSELHGSAKGFLENFGIEQLLLVPVFARDLFWGFIGFGLQHSTSLWPDSHLAIFHTYAVTLGITIAKDKDAELLKVAKDDAVAATRAKSDFLARMSHEIRTPMNAIVGWTHLALDKQPQPLQADYLTKIQSNSKALLGIINDILDFSKIEAGKLTLEHHPFCLDDLLDDLSNTLSYKAYEKELDLVFDIPAHLPRMCIGDGLRLKQVLINLLNNAIKFTAHGSVRLSARVEEAARGEAIFTFSVSDTGMGIQPEYLEFLFDSFSQGDVSTTRKFGGTGLGLAICKRLVTMMGGRIGVESAPGQGSHFYFTIGIKLQEEALRNPEWVPLLKDKRVWIVSAFESVRKVMADLAEFEHARVLMIPDRPSARSRMSLGEAPDLICLDWEESDDVSGQTNPQWVQWCKSEQVDLMMMVPVFGQNTGLFAFLEAHSVLYVTKPLIKKNFLEVMQQTVSGEPGTALPSLSQGVALRQLKFMSGVNVLLVEDNEANQIISIELLEMTGVNVTLAENGLVAVEKVQTNPDWFDVILMDIQMPVMDGYASARKIASLPHADGLPIVAMTADAFAGAEQRCLEAGMVDLIAKPIDPEELFAKLHFWVMQHRKATESKALARATDRVKRFDESQPHTLEGIDLNDGMKRFANRWDFFRRLLERFYEDHLNFIQEFDEVQVAGDRERAARLLHSFKGITGTIAARELYRLSILTEQAFLNQSDDFLSLFEQTKVELNALMSHLKKSDHLNI